MKSNMTSLLYHDHMKTDLDQLRMKITI